MRRQHRYRITGCSVFSDRYQLERRAWYWPFWMQCPEINTHKSTEAAAQSLGFYLKERLRPADPPTHIELSVSPDGEVTFA